MGFIGSANSFGGVIFLLLGGFLSDISWRMPFAIYLSSLIMLPLIIRFIDEPSFHKSQEVSLTLGKPVRELINLFAVYLLAFVSTLIFYLIPTELPFYLSLAGLSIFIYLIIACAFLLISCSKTYFHILLAMILNGAGIGLMFPNLNMWAAEFSNESNKGKVLGGLTTGIFLGMFASPFFSKLIKIIFTKANVFLYASFVLFALCVVLFVHVILKRQNKKEI